MLSSSFNKFSTSNVHLLLINEFIISVKINLVVFHHMQHINPLKCLVRKTKKNISDAYGYIDMADVLSVRNIVCL